MKNKIIKEATMKITPINSSTPFRGKINLEYAAAKAADPDVVIYA